MDELILAFLQDRISAADAARLTAWRSASPENERHFQSMQRVWRESDRRDPMAGTGEAPTLERLLGAPLSRSRGAEATARPKAPPPVTPMPTTAAQVVPARGRVLRSQRPRVWWLVGGMAAAAALFVAFLIMRPTPPDTMASLGSAEFVTDTEETATARLDDGSVVRLAPRSRLRVTHAAARRESWLDGEAFFAVAHDRTRPFRVRTRAGTVEVLGTRFDLKVEADTLRLIVTEGRVALTTNAGRRELVAGEMGTVDPSGEIQVVRVENAADLMAWTKGFLVFQDTPLRQVARELEERFAVRVLLPDSALAQREVTAWFTHQTIEQTLFAICRAVQAHCTLEGDVASIEP
ncbi:MAG TPA: FecR domain-containing protein [Gemmatimonadaceae bacterium]|nr:FecR domain-containing protein [Gemmatimonadaceae bacterium]